MGIRNVLAACAIDEGKLSAEARVTLIVMAAISFDEPQGKREARVYYGGYKTAMTRMGAYPDERAERRFIRHVAELKRRGIVEVVSKAAHGRNAKYRLLLPVDNSTDSVDKRAGTGET